MRGLITWRRLFGRKGMNILVTPCLAILQYRNCFISFLRPKSGRRKYNRTFFGRFCPVCKSKFQRCKNRPYYDGSSQPNFDCDFPAEQRHREAQSGDPPPHTGNWDLPGWEFCPDAGLHPVAVRGWDTMGRQTVYEYEASRGYFELFSCGLMPPSRRIANLFAHNS